MKITLKNVGVIKDATVDLTGLSVIVGKNGAGKSTVGKTIYAIVKAVKEKDDIVKQKKKEFTDWVCKNTYFTIQNLIGRNTNARQLNADATLLENNFQLGAFETDLIHLIDESDIDGCKRLIQSRINLIDSFSNAVDFNAKNKIKEGLISLKNSFVPSNMQNDIHLALVYMCHNIFGDQIINVQSHIESKVAFGNLLEYTVSNNADILPLAERLKIDYVDDSITEKIFQDATLIETPLLLQMEKIQNFNSLPNYWTDLMRKVASDSINSTLQNTFIQEAISDITDALGGKLEYNAKERRFDFIKKEFSEGTNLSINNAASGEKVLGIFQKLAKNGMFSPSKITILDEPENHLHPQWLMTLAEVLVKLVKSGCPIMIASHSPDFLQALRFYSKKHKLEQAKYYLADGETGIISDKTGKEYEIFDNLAKPINEIFESVVEDTLQD